MQINSVEIGEGSQRKIISSQDYYLQRRLEILSDDAKTLLAWLQRRGKPAISQTELIKVVVPVRLRRVTIISQLLLELVKLGFVSRLNGGVVYSGRNCRSCYRLTQ